MNKADRDFAEKLILEVQKRPLMSLPDHKDRYKIDLEWTTVAAEMDSTVEVVKRQWQNLRGSYCKNLAVQHQPNGSGAKSVPKFYLFDQMSFLAWHMAHAPVHGNYGVQQLTAQESQELVVEDTTSGHQEAEPSVSSTPEPTPSSSSASASTSTLSITLSSSQPSNKKHPQVEPSPGWEEAAAAFLTSRQPKPGSPEMDFFKGLVPMVRELSPCNKQLFF